MVETQKVTQRAIEALTRLFTVKQRKKQKLGKSMLDSHAKVLQELHEA